jgi:hypothetical protein
MEGDWMNYWISVLFLVGFVFVVFSGFVVYFVFISVNLGEESNSDFMGISEMNWRTWHDYSAWAVIALLFVYLILHFNWIRCMTIELFKKEEFVNRSCAKFNKL